MVYGALAMGGGKYYTYLNEVFAAAGSIQRDYNWLITEWVIYGIDELGQLEDEYCWMTGAELAALLEKYPDRQWVWGVLSGFEKSVSKEEALKYPLPYADMNDGFWKNPLTLQHPLAEIEIAAFDSSLVIFQAKDEKIVKKFQENFRPSEDLFQYNEQWPKNKRTENA